MTHESTSQDSIIREEIAYFVCTACGVVFPDRENPHDCPICALSRNADDGFTPYAESVCSSEKRV